MSYSTAHVRGADIVRQRNDPRGILRILLTYSLGTTPIAPLHINRHGAQHPTIRYPFGEAGFRRHVFYPVFAALGCCGGKETWWWTQRVGWNLTLLLKVPTYCCDTAAIVLYGTRLHGCIEFGFSGRLNGSVCARVRVSPARPRLITE